MSDYDKKKNSESDHDLILNINSKQNNLVDIFEKLTADFKERHTDHEERIRFLEKGLWIGIGGLAILQFVFKYFLK